MKPKEYVATKDFAINGNVIFEEGDVVLVIKRNSRNVIFENCGCSVFKCKKKYFDKCFKQFTSVVCHLKASQNN